MRHRPALLLVDDEEQFNVPPQPPSRRLAPALRRAVAVLLLAGAGFVAGAGGSIAERPELGSPWFPIVGLLCGVLLLASGRVAAAGLTGALGLAVVLVARPGAAWLGLPLLLVLLWIAPATLEPVRPRRRAR
jgi:hypothetical protein